MTLSYYHLICAFQGRVRHRFSYPATPGSPIRPSRSGGTGCLERGAAERQRYLDGGRHRSRRSGSGGWKDPPPAHHAQIFDADPPGKGRRFDRCRQGGEMAPGLTDRLVVDKACRQGEKAQCDVHADPR